MNLFQDLTGKWTSYEEALENLKKIGASDCETLFIHSDVMFGQPSKEFRRSEYLNVLLNLIKDLKVSNIIVPTFSYSFCNGEDFDIKNTKSYMGSFSEYVRKLPDSFRTRDPLLSFSIIGEIKEKFQNIKTTISLGVDGCYDILNRQENVKYLFLGADIADCFTYVHYVERMLEVPYRYDQPFDGFIKELNGTEKKETWSISTQCGGIHLQEKFNKGKEYMISKGCLKILPFGDKEIACISQKDAWNCVTECLKNDINFYLEKPFTEDELTKVYIMNKNGNRVTHC